MKIEYVLLLAVILIMSFCVMGWIGKQAVNKLDQVNQKLEQSVEAVK